MTVLTLEHDVPDVDLTDYCAEHGVTPSVAIHRLRQEVFDKTGLTVSAGVSPNKALSKICADVNKPNGAFVIDPTREACMEFMKGIRLRRCFGLGRVTETLLNSIGFETVGDLYTRRADLYLVVESPLVHFSSVPPPVATTADFDSSPRSAIIWARKRLFDGSSRCTSAWARIESFAPNAATARLTESSE